MSDLDQIRERGLEALTRAYTSDAITVSEFERRAALVQAARDRAGIEELIRDLPGEAPGDRPLSRRSEGSSRSEEGRRGAPLRVAEMTGSQQVSCVMGDRRLQGDWLSGDRVQCFTLMGSTKLDLRDVPIPADGLRIEAFVVMGEAVIIVPRNLAVRLNAFPFMGEANAARDVAQRAAPGDPVLRVDGFALMGSIRVVAAD